MTGIKIAESARNVWSPGTEKLTALLQGQAQQQGFTLEEVEQHNTEQDCWVIIKQRVRMETRPLQLPVSQVNGACTSVRICNQRHSGLPVRHR